MLAGNLCISLAACSTLPLLEESRRVTGAGAIQQPVLADQKNALPKFFQRNPVGISITPASMMA